MVTVSENENGYVIGLCEWRQVAKSGFDKVNGEYIWINHLWIHPEARNSFVMAELMDKILLTAPDAEWCYFTRKKYNGRMSKAYPRSKFMKIVEKSMVSNG